MEKRNCDKNLELPKRVPERRSKSLKHTATTTAQSLAETIISTLAELLEKHNEPQELFEAMDKSRNDCISLREIAEFLNEQESLEKYEVEDIEFELKNAFHLNAKDGKSSLINLTEWEELCQNILCKKPIDLVECVKGQEILLEDSDIDDIIQTVKTLESSTKSTRLNKYQSRLFYPKPVIQASSQKRRNLSTKIATLYQKAWNLPWSFPNKGRADRNYVGKLHSVESLSTATEVSRQSWKKEELIKKSKINSVVNNKTANLRKSFLRPEYEVKKHLGKESKVAKNTRRLIEDVRKTICGIGRKTQGSTLTNVKTQRKGLTMATPKNFPFIHF